jgi:hypothetical protein
MKTRTKSLKIKVKIKGNYEEKLSQEIISFNRSSREKCGNYREPGVSRKQGCTLITRSENH